MADEPTPPSLPDEGKAPEGSPTETPPEPEKSEVLDTKGEEKSDEDYFKEEKKEPPVSMKEHTVRKFEKLTGKYSSVRKENAELKQKLEELEAQIPSFDDDEDEEPTVNTESQEEMTERIIDKREKNKITTDFLISKGLKTEADRLKKGGQVAKIALEIAKSYGFSYEDSLSKAYNMLEPNKPTSDIGGMVTGGGQITEGSNKSLDEPWVTKNVSQDVIDAWKKKKKSN